MDNYGFADNP